VACAANERAYEWLRVESVAGGVSLESDAREIVGTAPRLFGGTDILMNNVGIYPSIALGKQNWPICAHN
jgi:NAD(P)-dependent dehydrogenase (short-subunit alcohol dehydrogenase family)